MYGHFPLFHNHFYPPPKYISDFSNISAQLQIYRRFSKYIGATPNISAIFEIYRLTDKNRHNIHT
ncbi:hypothetical protein COJ37_01755 [Bacillus cereus]|uniref:Uncharacterized protein n=2 Tax=Bacillus cereus group TaxID=86661 RepID=A0A9X7AM19_BACTU|nr:hypothetical protein BVH75_23955 [Bacillus thuringiensis]OTX82494.1 hypothetical protein BK726_22330 [Bacillus thuringiensis serovar londrina]PEA95693.1 hypothetical protein CON66_13125 [Bacillus cereus]PFB79631.1 hypothetical protein CN286_12660 [Bacillus anthracis]MBZ8122730.1 hypothetical protein [Bacillus thuringiensis]